MSGLSRLRRKSARSAQRNLRYSIQDRDSKIIRAKEDYDYVQDPLEYYFMRYKHLIMGELNDMLPALKESNNLLHNGVYEQIETTKIGLMYLDKIKRFCYVSLNDEDNRMYILFKEERLNQLPYIKDNTDLMKIHKEKKLKVIENGNKIVKLVYSKQKVIDLTVLPAKEYKIKDLIK